MNDDIKSLLKAVRDDDWQIRWLAVSALAEIRESGALRGIIEALKVDDRQVRSKSSRVLSRVNDPAVLSPATEALLDSNNYVRERAGLAVEKIGDEAVDSVVQLLSRERRLNARRKIITLLGRIGDPQIANFLTPYLKDDDGALPGKQGLFLRSSRMSHGTHGVHIPEHDGKRFSFALFGPAQPSDGFLICCIANYFVT